MASQRFLITGFPRSGTTLLRQLCNTNPQLFVTHEHGLHFIRKPSPIWQLEVMKKGLTLLWAERHYPTGPRPEIVSDILRYFPSYLLASLRYGAGPDAITEALKWWNPGSLVGDKFPDYRHSLTDLTSRFPIVVALRQPIDVVASCLKRIRNTSDRAFMPWLRGRDDAVQRLCQDWCSWSQTLRLHLPSLHILEYERLLTEPKSELDALAGFLEVDGDFDLTLLRPPSGFAQELPKEERELIVDATSKCWQQLQAARATLLPR